MDSTKQTLDHFAADELEARFEMAPWVEIGPAPCKCDETPEVPDGGGA